jgi:hypothetical protein
LLEPDSDSEVELTALTRKKAPKKAGDEIEYLGRFSPIGSEGSKRSGGSSTRKKLLAKTMRNSFHADSDDDNDEDDASSDSSSDDDFIRSSKKKKKRDEMIGYLKNSMKFVEHKLKKSKQQNKELKKMVFEMQKQIAGHEDVVNRYKNTMDAIVEKTISCPQLAPAIDVMMVPGAEAIIEKSKYRVQSKLERRRRDQ